MKGSIRFDNEINVEVAVDPSQDEGAKLLSAVNLVDGQRLSPGGGGSDTVIVTETDGTLDITPNQLKAALAEGKRVGMYFEDAEEGIYEQDFISTITQNADNEIHTFSYMIAFSEGGAHIEAVQNYSSDGGDNPFVAG